MVAGEADYVTYTVEKFVLGQGFIVEPIQIPIQEGDTVKDVTKRAMGDNVKFKGDDYVSAFYDGLRDEEALDIDLPDYVIEELNRVRTDMDDLLERGRQDSGWLTENDYYDLFGFGGAAGWMYCVNDDFPNVGSSSIVLEGGDVIRWQYSLMMGVDIGSEMGVGTWGPKVLFYPENRDALSALTAFASKEGLVDMAYDNALAILSDMESESTAIFDAYNSLATALAPFELEDLIASQIVKDKILAIGEVSTDSKQAIEEARAAYEALNKPQKTLLPNLAILTQAEEAYGALVEGNEDAEAAKAVDELIAQIGDPVRLEDADAIAEARAAYEGLNEAQKDLVIQLDKLEAAEETLADIQAAKAVEDKIASIGKVTLESKEAIEEARAAYDKLSEVQKDLVSNYDTLTDAEASYRDLVDDNEDEAAAKAVDELIAQINDPVNLEDAEAIANARAAYENLSQEQKDLVTKLDKLESAEKALVDLQAAKAVEDKIAAIGEVTLESKEAIEEARAAYEKLSEVQKELVPNHGTLIEAEEAYKALISDKSDEERAKYVDDLIDEIGDPVTLEDAEKIQRARAAYAYLTEEQQKLVTKLEELEAAERSLKELEEEKDQDAADEVIKAIDELPTDITLKDKEQVAKARQAYDALSQEQRALVDNEEKLISAEKAIQELEQAAEKVAEQIKALPKEIRLKDKEQVAKVLQAYDALSEEQKALVNNKDKLMAAENAIQELEQEAEKVAEQIKALPKDITLKDKEQVAKARKAYDALSKEQRALISNEGKLKEAEGKIKQLEEDKVAADKVIDLIHALPDKITLADKEKVEEALVAYNELTEEQKALVDNVNKLIEAKEEITRLEKEEPGTDPGEDPKEPGKDPGKDPDKGPGKEPKDPGKDPSKGPGKDSGKDLGKGSKNTKTGDTFSPIHWISILGLSAVGVFVIRRKKKKTA